MTNWRGAPIDPDPRLTEAREHYQNGQRALIRLGSRTTLASERPVCATEAVAEYTACLAALALKEAERT